MALNRWIGMGRLTKDADVRYAQKQDGEQMCVARFTLAIDRRGKDAGADFINCVVLGKQGEFVGKYLHKGIKVAVSGRIQTGSYKNKDGNTIYTTEVLIDEIEFAESKKSEQPSEPNEPNESDGFMDVPDDLGLPFGTKR